MPPSKSVLPYLAPLALLLGAGLYHSLVVPWSDFAGYYTGSRFLLKGDFPGAYDMQALNDHIAAAGYKAELVSYAPFPPFTSLIFAPLTLFPMTTAKFLFNFISASLFLLTVARAIRYFGISRYFALVVPVIFFIPIINNIFFGQAYLLLCILLLEGFMAHQERRYWLSSLLWGIAIVFKLFPALIFAYLLFRRKYRSLIYLSMSCILLFTLSVLINGFESWEYYGMHILPKVNNGQLNDPFTYVFQSAFMLSKKTFVYDALLNPHPLVRSPLLFIASMALFKALILTICILFTISKRATGRTSITATGKDDDLSSFAIWITASILLSPNGSSYSLIILFIPLLAMATRFYPFREVNRSFAVAASVLLLVACNIPVIRLSTLPTWAQFPRLYLLLIFFILLAAPLAKYWNMPLAASLTTLFFILALPGQGRIMDSSTYLLDREDHLYICDYRIKNNTLVYYYRDQSGQHEVSTELKVYAATQDDLMLRDEQIWYKGHKLTSGPDRKEKPTLINYAYIVYLSDKDRGVDFYTLRQLTVPLSY
jgi:hypothetical protein